MDTTSNRLQLYYPVTPYAINQPFGFNGPCVRNFGKPDQEIVAGIDNNTCPVGYEKLYPKFGMAAHNGLDLKAGEQNVYAAHDGLVIEKQTVPARGLCLGILTNEPVDLDQYGTHYIKIRYWHLKMMFVDVGDQVKAGDLIGISDNTGYSSGDHLHFEGQPMDKDAGGHPYLSFNSPGENPAGVIAAAIDLEPFFNGQYAEQIATVASLYQKLIVVLLKLIHMLKSS